MSDRDLLLPLKLHWGLGLGGDLGSGVLLESFIISHFVLRSKEVELSSLDDSCFVETDTSLLGCFMLLKHVFYQSITQVLTVFRSVHISKSLPMVLVVLDSVSVS